MVQEALRQFEEPTLFSCAGSAGALPLASLQVPHPYSLLLFSVGLEPHVTPLSGLPRPAAHWDRLEVPKCHLRSVQ